jgi:hypothetical protein
LTLTDFKAKYSSDLRNHTVAALKGNAAFMALCVESQEIRDYVLRERSDMKREDNPYKVTFKKQEKFVPVIIKEPEPVKAVKPEAVSDSPTIAELIKDIHKYRKTKGFKRTGMC